jgi:hypothetical protein
VIKQGQSDGQSQSETADVTQKSNRPRRIARRATLIAAGVVLLPVSYIASVSSLAYAVHARLLPAWVETSALTSVYVTPLVWFVNDTELPGSDVCEAVVLWSCEAGERARN